MRVHLACRRMSLREADILEYYLKNVPGVTAVKVFDRTQDAIITYQADRTALIRALAVFSFTSEQAVALVPEHTSRQLNREYEDKLVFTVCRRAFSRLFLPYPITTAIALFRSVKYIKEGLKALWHGKLSVAVLDATAVTVSMLRGDFNTAGSVMFMLRLGEILEEWTHKKSVADLAGAMALNVDKVWLQSGETELLVPIGDVRPGDRMIVRTGNLIPLDGKVVSGEATVNQASITGESLPVAKRAGSYVYAGTVIEEGECVVSVEKALGGGRYDRIVHMIEESEKLKSGMESRAEHLADRLVPYSLLGTALTYLLTRNATKALAILMVDYSCALKLAMPVTVLSAIREAGAHSITVKGGKYLEAMAEADTILFDKTGTLTKARPSVVSVVSFNGMPEDELLRIAACMEEPFPHSMAKAVVDAASRKGLVHEEMHSKVDYIVAHGIATTINGKRAVIGSYHFIVEDEQCVIPEDKKALFDSLPTEYSHLYLGLENRLAAVICIEDPLREEAPAVIEALRSLGMKKIVMMTGDSERTARAIARKVGMDEYYSEVLPEDKAGFVEKEQALGHKVIMIGDGINDSLALSKADVGIAISDGAEVAREIADVTIAAEDLTELITFHRLSTAMVKRIHRNYRNIVGINSGLIALGVTGVIPPTLSALLHNTSTIAISLKSMEKLL